MEDVQTLAVLVDILEDVDLSPSGVVFVAHGPAISVSSTIVNKTSNTHKAGQTPHPS